MTMTPAKEEVSRLLETMDDWIEAWHDGPNTGVTLHRYLQMSWTEYQEFVQRPQEWAQNILVKRSKDHSRLET